MVAAEVKAVRETVGIMDVTAFTKVLVEGPDAYGLRFAGSPHRKPYAPKSGVHHAHPHAEPCGSD